MCLGRGEFFSRGLAQPLQGSSEWATYEIPFLLNEHGVRADLAKLNVAFDGGTGALALKPSMDAPHVITQCAMRETPSFLVSVSRTAASSRNPL